MPPCSLYRQTFVAKRSLASWNQATAIPSKTYSSPLSRQQPSPFSILATPTPHTPRPTHINSAPSRAQLIAKHLSTSTSSSAAKYNGNMSGFSIRKVNQPNTLEHRIYIEKNGIPCSPFHDIPLYANEQQTILNMIVEIPRWTNGKLEVRLKRSLRSPPARTCLRRARRPVGSQADTSRRSRKKKT